MSCKQYQDALAEAALGAALAADLRAHVADCAACRNELERLRALSEAIVSGVAEMVRVEPSLGFAARVRARVAEESTERSFWWRSWIPALAGGAAVLALAAWLLWPPAKIESPKGPQEVARASSPSKGIEPSPSSTMPTPTPVSGRSVPAETPKQMAANRSRQARRLAAKVAPQPALPEVLVSGDEWNLVVRLYTLAQRGQVKAETAAAPETTPLEAKFQPLEIALLKPIAPLGETQPPPTEPRK